MKHIALCTLLIISVKYKAQSVNWTKDDRNNMYSDCMSYATKYKSISAEQKESICLCYLEETTRKYIKSDFEAKIEIEVKRIKDAMLTQCAKNIGVELSTKNEEAAPEIKKAEISDSKETVKTKATKIQLLGKWKTDKGSVLEFKDGGKYTETNSKRESLVGDWFLDDSGTLTIITEKQYIQLITKKEKVDRKTSKYDFDYFNKDYFKMSKEGELEVVQANRMR
jgi:hypothetical protein